MNTFKFSYDAFCLLFADWFSNCIQEIKLEIKINQNLTIYGKKKIVWYVKLLAFRVKKSAEVMPFLFAIIPFMVES